MKSGAYAITSPSGGFYIGSAVNFKARRTEHFNDMRAGRHHNAPLQAAYRKYGKDALVFRPIIICSREDLLLYEQLAIDALSPPYNTCRLAGRTSGVIQSSETRAKRSATMKGRVFTAEHREQISVARRGQPSPNKGRQMSEEQRAKLSALKTGKPGPPRSQETRALIAESKRGKKRQPQHVEKYADSMRGAANRNNTSGFPGVAWHKQSGKWFGQFSFKGKRIFCGAHPTPAEAYVAIQYRMAELGLLTIGYAY